LNRGSGSVRGELLTPAYEGLIEGFNTRDLKEANGPLDELNV
jgi:hypothetical protein